MHKRIWDEIEEREFLLPDGKNRIRDSYETGALQASYVETIGVGDLLPDMPLFLTNGWQIPVPLEATDNTTWNSNPEDDRFAVESRMMPEPDSE